MVQTFALALGYRGPPMRAADSVDAERASFLTNVEAERRVEFLRDLQIGDDQVETVH
jgi:hypothetical protein